MQHRSVDVVVVGAGIVGLATARAILARYPGTRVVVLEKEPAIAQHQTGRNSGVIHSGLYYTPGSLKARLCVEGAAELMAYCDRHRIAYRRCGKVVVATEPEELPRLAELYRRGVANGVQGLELISPERLREIEPHAVGLQAIFSPNTGIVDYRQVAAALVGDIHAGGGEIRLSAPLQGIVRQGSDVRVSTPTGTLVAGCLVTCAGLHSDRVAALSGAGPIPRIIPFRGDYYLLRPERRYLIRGLIYPVPDPAFPFLGIHSTLRMDGSVWLGPNAVLAFAREGYHRLDANLLDLWDAISYHGFRTLARTYWRTGLAEMIRDWSKARFTAAAQRFVPELTPADLMPGPSGIRAQALAPDGKLVDDFVIDQDGPIIHVRNAPSPAATSSLAIAERITDVAAQAKSTIASASVPRNAVS
ncbi:MAG: L-2-hydroxyglutarate oxidase [Herpetosiphonaceae bacterium]|nr:L-2-hydroxyglutarate oxidase [Herpetosiphonaceae bacterium]